MALLNDLKKLFFGAKSVAKHQAERASEVAQEAASELREQGSELLDQTQRAANDLVEKAPDYVDRGKEALNDLQDKVWKEADSALDKGKELRDQASDLVNNKFKELNLERAEEVPESEAPKSGSIDFESDLVEGEPPTPKEPSALKEVTDNTLDAAARAGLAAKEKAGELGNELLERAAKTGAKLKDKADDFIDHANTEAEKMKMEEAIEKAKAAADQAEARARAFDGEEGKRDTSESVLDGTDSFFDRADRFAKGDYHDEGGKPVRIQEDPDYTPEKKSDLIAGFLDSDGDGDSLIDDAVIEDEDEEKED